MELRRLLLYVQNCGMEDSVESPVIDKVVTLGAEYGTEFNIHAYECMSTYIQREEQKVVTEWVALVGEMFGCMLSVPTPGIST